MSRTTIYLIGEYTTDCIHAGLLKGSFKEIMTNAEWAVASDTDIPFYRWLHDKRWQIITEFDIKPAGFIMYRIRNEMHKDGRLAEICGGPVKWIDKLGTPQWHRCSVARRNSTGTIVEIHPSIKDFSQRTLCSATLLPHRIFNAESFRIRRPTYEGYFRATGHKYHPLWTPRPASTTS